MKHKAVLLFLITSWAVAGIFSAFRPAASPQANQHLPGHAHFSIHKAGLEKTDVHWIDITEIEEALKKEKRKVIVVLYTDWCGWCKRLERETLQNEQVAGYLNEKYYAVRFNAEQQQEVNFKGKTYKFVKGGRRGYNELAYELTRGRLSYPTCVFLDENLELIQSIPGYKSAEDFQDIITYFGDNYYREMPWDRFIRQRRE